MRTPAVRLAAFVVLCMLLTVPDPAGQQSVLPERVRAAADRITADQLARDLQFLASDELEGRNTPSPGFDKAAEHIAERLRRAGLKPIGDNGTYFQRYEMRESHVDTANAFLEVGGRRLKFGDDFVIRSFAGPVSGSLPIVYVGHGWVVPGRKIDPYAGVDVRGKIVVAHGPRALPKGVNIPQQGRVSVGATPVLEEAARRGAAAVVFIAQADAMKGSQQMRAQNTTRRELEPSVPSAYAAPGITSVMIGREAAEALLGSHASRAAVLAAAESSDYPPSFELTDRAALNIPVASTVVHRPYNVVALLEGSDPALKGEYITVEAHLDGAVGQRTVEGDSIYNSADDNASGSAGALAIAEQMAAVRPKQSVVFIWDSGEERGLWGTRWFVHAPPVPLARVVAHFDVDMIGASREPGSPDASVTTVTSRNEVYLIGPGVLSASADALLERVNREYFNIRLNRDHDRADSEFFYPRSDAGPFLERGILTIGFTTGIHPRYHQPSDEARHLDPKQMEAITRTVFASVWVLADSPERPRIDKEIPPSVLRYGAKS